MPQTYQRALKIRFYISKRTIRFGPDFVNKHCTRAKTCVKARKYFGIISESDQTRHQYPFGSLPADPSTNSRAFFKYITTGAFTPVCPLFAPVVKQDSQINWALLIISKKSTLLKKLPAFSYPLTFSTFHLIKVRTVKGGAKRVAGGWVWVLEHPQSSGSRQLSNPSWIGRKETKIFE
jgi:hypothetical protein